ncbi:MAG: TetR family transcriptional regulator [Ilumatobacteraceae bacterium]
MTTRKRPAHRPSRRQSIIDAAIRVFAERGFVDTALTDVAEAADVAVTAVYYHFSGKDELFGAAMRHVLEADQ